ncbi:MAG6790 family protein [Mycoplasma phocoenae]|uniref:Uncharacterized protein n=1 Tax=Mycoplasma phocoenae TaxID=754517 RepID=A0A858U979_9MOLU|nr:hypothetical protein [Mycoplasma phocoenae]QJG67258.1 hypothetical protein HGG69_03060 [Mycoplasma phocoenae]
MYKYKAKLLVNQNVIASANTLEQLKHQILSFRRKQKYNEHTFKNEKIQIIHVERDHVKGKHKSKEDVLTIV